MDPKLEGDDAPLRHPTPRPRRLLSSSWVLWPAPLAFLALFYFYPLGSILSVSFARAEAGIAAALLDALRAPSVLGVLWFTIWQAAVSTLLTLIVGLPGAYLLARYDFRGKSILRALTGIPFVLPTLVVAAAFNALLGPSGWANLALMEIFDLTAPPIQFTRTLWAIFTAHVFYNTTIVLRMVGDFWSRLDPQLDAAAKVLGAPPWERLRRITLPLLTPAIATAALLVFIFDFTSFGVILILGGPRYGTLEVEIYYQTVSFFNLPLAASLSVLQLACTLGLTVLYSRLSARLSRPLSLRPRRITQRTLASWRSRLAAGVVVVVLLALLTSPLAALAARSLTHLGPTDPRDGELSTGFTLDFYRELSARRPASVFFVPPIAAVRNSLGFASLTVLLALALGLPASWALAREARSISSRALDPILMLPLGTSAVTLGLGFILALNRPPLDLRASVLIVPIAHTLVAFPFVVRSLTPALRSIKPQLRQAAAVMGAPPRRVLLAVDLPLIGRALLVAAAFAFSISMGEFGATALIARPEYPTIPVAIFRFLSRPGALNFGQALALSTILMLVTGAGMIAIERLRIAEVGEF